MDLGVDFIHLWHLVSISIEGITYSKDLISNEITIPEHYEIDCLKRTINLFVLSLVHEILGEHERLSFGHSENESLQSFDINGVNDTSNFVEVASTSSCGLGKQLLILTSLNVTWLTTNLLESLLNIWKHLLGSLHNLKGIHQIRQSLFSLFELSTLSLDESFLLADLTLNLFKEQVQCLLFLGADQFELLQETINTLGRIDVDSMSLAFLM